MSSPMLSQVHVRQATLADLETVVELRIALLREHGTNPVYGRLRADAQRRGRRLFATQLNSDAEVTLLAESAGRSAGILRCMIGTSSPLLYPERYGYVASVYVVPEQRRRGVLKRLLAEAERWCYEHGLEELRLHNASDNKQANDAWESLGFGVVEHLRMRALTRVR